MQSASDSSTRSPIDSRSDFDSADGASPKTDFARANIDLNSSISNIVFSSPILGRGAVCVMSIFTGASLRRTISWALRNTRSRLSSNPCFNLGVCSSAASKTETMSWYFVISFAAVFSPTPGTPSRLSLGSPRNAAYCEYCAGVTPVRSTIPASSYNA